MVLFMFLFFLLSGYNMPRTALHQPLPTHTSTGYIQPPAAQVDYPHQQAMALNPTPHPQPYQGVGELQGPPLSQYGRQSPPYHVSSSPALAQSGVSPHHHLGHHSSSAQPLGDHMYNQYGQQQLGHHASSAQYLGTMGGNHHTGQQFRAPGMNQSQQHLAATGGGGHTPQQFGSSQQFSVGQQHVQPVGGATGGIGAGVQREMTGAISPSRAHTTVSLVEALVCIWYMCTGLGMCDSWPFEKDTFIPMVPNIVHIHMHSCTCILTNEDL